MGDIDCSQAGISIVVGIHTKTKWSLWKTISK
jgi:hypothetical protein